MNQGKFPQAAGQDGEDMSQNFENRQNPKPKRPMAIPTLDWQESLPRMRGSGNPSAKSSLRLAPGVSMRMATAHTPYFQGQRHFISR